MRKAIIGVIFGTSAATVSSMAFGVAPWVSAPFGLAALVFWAGYEAGRGERAQSST
jgi:hypothetical protein